MDQLKTDAWKKALDRLNACPPDKRDHYAMIITALADCYGEGAPAKAVVLIERDDCLGMFSAGAEAMVAAEMVGRANAAFHVSVMADAPEKGMFN